MICTTHWRRSGPRERQIDVVMETFYETLVKALDTAGEYNAADQVAPAGILWTDKDRQWEKLIPLLAERLPVFSLGVYNLEFRSGPAYWLRCVIAGAFPELFTPGEIIPILYLPGVSRQEIPRSRGMPACAAAAGRTSVSRCPVESEEWERLDGGCLPAIPRRGIGN